MRGAHAQGTVVSRWHLCTTGGADGWQGPRELCLLLQLLTSADGEGHGARPSNVLSAGPPGRGWGGAGPGRAHGQVWAGTRTAVSTGEAWSPLSQGSFVTCQATSPLGSTLLRIFLDPTVRTLGTFSFSFDASTPRRCLALLCSPHVCADACVSVPRGRSVLRVVCVFITIVRLDGLRGRICAGNVTGWGSGYKGPARRGEEPLVLRRRRFSFLPAPRSEARGVGWGVPKRPQRRRGWCRGPCANNVSSGLSWATSW